MFILFELFGLSLNFASLMTITPLLLGLVSHQYLSKNVLLGLIVLSVVIGLIVGTLSLTVLPSLLLLISLCAFFQFSCHPMLTIFLAAGIFVISILFMLHLLPGFNNPVVIDNVQLSQNAPPYTKYLNFDKAILGLVLLCFMVPKCKMPKLEVVIKVSLVVALCTIVGFGVGIFSGLVIFEPKLPAILVGWILTNLLLTCFVEEAFFRGFIQQQLQRINSSRGWQISSVMISGGLFGLAHIPGGMVYCLIATVMGIGYAYSYYRTNNIYLPIATHFIFNLLHFCLFSYPYLAN